MPKAEEQFSEEQRYELALLHDEIDAFNQDFYTDHVEEIIYTIEPKPSKGKETAKKKDKKERHVFAINFSTLTDEEKMSYKYFTDRMMIITKNIVVRSIRNKLISFYPDGARMTISSTSSYKGFKETYEKISNQLDAVTELENPTGDAEEEIPKLKKLLDFMDAHEQFIISGRSQSDSVTYCIYDEEESVLATRSYFRGGVVIPITCTVREPLKRKPRSDNKMKGKEILTNGNKMYILDATTQYGE